MHLDVQYLKAAGSSQRLKCSRSAQAPSRIIVGSHLALQQHMWEGRVLVQVRSMTGGKKCSRSFYTVLEAPCGSHQFGQQPRPIVEICGKFWVVGAQCLLPNLNSSKVQRVCFSELALEGEGKTRNGWDQSNFGMLRRNKCFTTPSC